MQIDAIVFNGPLGFISWTLRAISVNLRPVGPGGELGDLRYVLIDDATMAAILTRLEDK